MAYKSIIQNQNPNMMITEQITEDLLLYYTTCYVLLKQLKIFGVGLKTLTESLFTNT